MNLTPSQAELAERRRLDSARARTATSASTRPLLLPCLPAALRRLIGVLRQRLDRPGLHADQRDAWMGLVGELELLVGLQPLRHHFERAVSACHVAGFHDTEGYLEFLYTATYDVLTDCTARWLRVQRVQDDAESAAVDLVSQLFLELADRLFEGEGSGRDDGTGVVVELDARLPVPGRVLPWLLRALRNDVLDRVKGANNRLTRATPEQPLEVLMASMPLGLAAEEGALSPLELAERREAFLSAFGRATLHLKPQHQRVLYLREVESLKPDVIAQTLGLTRQQVIDQLQYGREKRAELLLSQLIRNPATRDLESDAERLRRLLSRVSLSPLAAALAAPPGETAERAGASRGQRGGAEGPGAQYVLGGLDPQGDGRAGVCSGEPGHRPLASLSSGESPPAGAVRCLVKGEGGLERASGRVPDHVVSSGPVTAGPTVCAELVPLSARARAAFVRKTEKR